jgi:hypothetical protein
MAEVGGHTGNSTSGSARLEHPRLGQVGIVSFECTILAPFVTFALSPACTGDILALPTSGNVVAKINSNS